MQEMYNFSFAAGFGAVNSAIDVFLSFLFLRERVVAVWTPSTTIFLHPHLLQHTLSPTHSLPASRTLWKLMVWPVTERLTQVTLTHSHMEAGTIHFS